MTASKSSSDPFNILKELEKTRIQRELAIAQILERRRLAYKLAEEREKLNWTASGGLVTSVLTMLSSYHHKNLIHLLPIVPIAAYVGYNAHFCYGNKVELLNKLTTDYIETVEKTSLSSITVEDNIHMGQRSSTPQGDSVSLRKYADEKMEEELALRHVQFVRNKALEHADLQEAVGWEMMAAGTMTAVLLFAGSVYKRKDLVVPIVPLIMGVGYRYDRAYGTQLSNIQEAAKKLLRKDPKLFEPIGGPITLAQVDVISKTL